MASYYDEIASSPEPDEISISDLISAARTLSDMLTRRRIRHAFMGGFACSLIGSTRQTGDVDCCVETDWRTLREVLAVDERFELPKSKQVSGVMRIYVTVDSKQKIQVDLLQAGEGAGPRHLDKNTMIVQDLPTLTHTELIRTKLYAYSKRDSLWDGADIVFLLRMIDDKLVKARIPVDEAEYFVTNFDWEAMNLHEEQEKATKALLS